MPNGGIPVHMALYPKDGSQFVIYCKGAQFQLHSRAIWDQEGVNGAPLCTLTSDEAAALTWFLKHFLGEAKLQPGWHMRGAVKADFDF